MTQIYSFGSSEYDNQLIFRYVMKYMLKEERIESSDCLTIFPKEIWNNILSFYDLTALASLDKTSLFFHRGVIALFFKRKSSLHLLDEVS